ncbi:unnamed protein product [Urochloa humidicola]
MHSKQSLWVLISAVSDSRSMHAAEQQECRQTSALGGFVSSFSPSVYWSLSAEADLLQSAHLAVAIVHQFAIRSHHGVIHST